MINIFKKWRTNKAVQSIKNNVFMYTIIHRETLVRIFECPTLFLDKNAAYNHAEKYLLNYYGADFDLSKVILVLHPCELDEHLNVKREILE